jgi:hypothetical protein
VSFDKVSETKMISKIPKIKSTNRIKPQLSVLEPVIECMENENEEINSSNGLISNSFVELKSSNSFSQAKNVSFSLTNQMIKSDNTVITSSAIVPSYIVEDDFSQIKKSRISTGTDIRSEIISLTEKMSQSQSSKCSASGSHFSASIIDGHKNKSFLKLEKDVEELDVLQNGQKALSDKAVIVIRRVLDKLTGLDFNDNKNKIVALDVPDQVDRLINEATSNENLSLNFFGWCPFW